MVFSRRKVDRRRGLLSIRGEAEEQGGGQGCKTSKTTQGSTSDARLRDLILLCEAYLCRVEGNSP
jgi:hypothetical protein